MKNKIPFLLFTFFCILIHQDSKAQFGHLGLKVGLSYSNLESSLLDTRGQQFLYGGLEYMKEITPRFNISLELFYAQKGTKMAGRLFTPVVFGGMPSQFQEYSIAIHSLNLALVGELYLTKNPLLSLQLGPIISTHRIKELPIPPELLHFGNFENTEDNLAYTQLAETYAAGGYMRNQHYSFLLGLSLGSQQLRGNLRYHHSLKKLPVNSQYETHLWLMEFSLGVRFYKNTR